MKKGFIILCVLILLFTAVFAAADDTVYTEGYFYYTISDKSITITGYFGNDTVVVIPAGIAGIPVNAIGPNAFAGSGVQIIFIPDTVREIAENAVGDAEVRLVSQITPKPPQGTGQPTQAPTATQVPTATPMPTATQVPTATPMPTAAQVPTATPTTTATQAPTATQESTVTQAPPATPTNQASPATPTPVPTGSEAIEGTEPPQDTPAATDVTVTAAPEHSAAATSTSMPVTACPVGTTPSADDIAPAKNFKWLWILLAVLAAILIAAATAIAVRKRK